MALDHFVYPAVASCRVEGRTMALVFASPAVASCRVEECGGDDDGANGKWAIPRWHAWINPRHAFPFGSRPE